MTNLLKESLNQTAVWTTVMAVDIECLPHSHKSYDGIKKERHNL